ncbi:MAG: 1-acyl-sn-glycerol-3-phosphate acyltransferase [Cyanophyceae cyanobacterium]
MAQSFYPPRLNPFLVRLAQFISPGVTRWFYQFELVISPHSLEKLRLLRDERLLLLPNHPTFQDPVVMFTLSAQVGQMFYYLAALELLSSSLGSILQRLGVYSIRRGLVDRPSIAQTLTLLRQPGCHLVVFPEGGCSFQNDTVMPFRAGAVQLAFQAMNKSFKQEEPLPELYAVPVSIKYRYTQDMSGVIEQTLNRLEKALRLNREADATAYQRLQAIAEQVLVKIEQDYGLQAEEPSWEQRISRLRTHALEKCEYLLGITSNLHELVRERTYKIEYALKTQMDEVEAHELNSDHAYHLALIEKSVKRLFNFDAIYDGYVAAHPTPERFLDTLIRLEREVFDIDQPPPKGFREARVEIGEPISLKNCFADYQRDRTATVNAVMLKVQQTVQENLDRLSQEKEAATR